MSLLARQGRNKILSVELSSILTFDVPTLPLLLQVNYLLTTDGEILVNTIKIQDARAKGIPFLSEAAITDTIATGEWPEDLSDYVLDGSPPLKRTAAKKSAAAAAPARAKKTKATLEEADEEASAPARKKTVATKPTRAKASAAKKAEEEEEEAPAPARGKAKAAAAAAKATSSRAASADMDVDPTPEAKAPAIPAKTTDTTPALERGPTALDMTDKRSEVVFSFDTTGSMYPCLTVLRLKIKECVERLFSEIGAENLRYAPLFLSFTAVLHISRLLTLFLYQ